MRNLSLKVFLLIALVLILDQALKFWVKTNMTYGEEIMLLPGMDWARLHFVENNGMAFGYSLGGDYGKLALSLFRILAVSFLIYYIRLLINARVRFSLLASFALILAGAIGNIIDSAFYGLIFSASHFHGDPAILFPDNGGYASFLHGKVVDMFYFPMFKGVFPNWIPLWGGEPFLFFKPVFNIADVAISIGVIHILVFNRSFFSALREENSKGDLPINTEDESQEEDSESKLDLSEKLDEQSSVDDTTFNNESFVKEGEGPIDQKE